MYCTCGVGGPYRLTKPCLCAVSYSCIVQFGTLCTAQMVTLLKSLVQYVHICARTLSAYSFCSQYQHWALVFLTLILNILVLISWKGPDALGSG